MQEEVLRRAVIAYVEAGIPPATDLRGRVVAGVADVRRWHGRRAGWALIAAAAATLAASAVAYAVDGQNFPARLRLLPAAGQAGHVDKSKVDVAKAVTKAPADAPVKRGPALITVAAAEQGLGVHLLTVQGLPGAQLAGVYFAPAQPLPDGAKPGSKPMPSTATLVYAYAGSEAQVQESLDASRAPLTVDAINADGPKIKSGQGLGPVAVEKVGGSDYVVGRTTDGSGVEWLIWKTGAGLVVQAHFEGGVSREQAFALAAHMR